MSPTYRFDLATEKDDPALRAVLNRTSMPGAVSVSFRREPSFFEAERVGNLDSQVITVRETATGSVVGLGSRSFRSVFVDGKPSLVGYLSNLRGLPHVRAGTLLARGYRFLKELHADGRVPYYVTTILDDNRYARRLLTSRRAGLPVYQSLGQLHTYLIPLYRHWKLTPLSPNIIRGVHGDQLQAVVNCFNDFNQRHQFAPRYTVADFRGGTPLLHGFSLGDLYVYLEGAAITATLGVWDQTSFKQTLVTGYSWQYQIARPFCAAASALGLSPRMPPVGQPLPCVYASLLSFSPERATHLGLLLRTVLRDWSRQGYAYLIAGVHGRSPAGNLLRRYAVSCRSSTLFLVYWQDMLDCSLPSLEPIPHLEVATL